MGSPEATGRWHLITANPRQEQTAAFHLKKAGHDVYLPLRVVKTKDRIGVAPFFPGYMFVQVKSAGEWWSIFSTIGVRSVIGTRERPSPVPPAVIEALRAQEQEGYLDLFTEEQMAERFKEGDEVTVKLGAKFAELKAIFIEPVDSNRCAVLVKLIGRDSRQVIPMSRVT